MSAEFNYELWKKDLDRCEQSIRAIKDILREPYQPRKYEHTYRPEAPQGMRFTSCTEQHLLDLKKEATLLYAARAHCRGRIHRKGDTWEGQNELIGAPGCTRDAHRRAA